MLVTLNLLGLPGQFFFYFILFFVKGIPLLNATEVKMKGGDCDFINNNSLLFILLHFLFLTTRVCVCGGCA